MNSLAELLIQQQFLPKKTGYCRPRKKESAGERRKKFPEQKETFGAPQAAAPKNNIGSVYSCFFRSYSVVVHAGEPGVPGRGGVRGDAGVHRVLRQESRQQEEEAQLWHQEGRLLQG